MGPLISMAHRDRVDGFVRRAVDQGANTYLRVLSPRREEFCAVSMPSEEVCDED